MREGCDGFGFTFKPGKGDGVVRQLRGKDFDGNPTLQPAVASAIHLAHASCAKGAEHFIGAKARTRREGHVAAAHYARVEGRIDR